MENNDERTYKVRRKSKADAELMKCTYLRDKAYDEPQQTTYYAKMIKTVVPLYLVENYLESPTMTAEDFWASVSVYKLGIPEVIDTINGFIAKHGKTEVVNTIRRMGILKPSENISTQCVFDYDE